jgi:hypothetical protein
MKKILPFSLILINIIVFAQPVQAITDSSTASRITSNTTWSNTSVPYEYSGGVEVAEGATLIITPGVKVQNTTFYLYGNLSIQGTSSSPTLLDRVRLKGPQTGLCPCPRVNITYAAIENSPDFMWNQFGNSSISNSYFLNLENAGGSASEIWYPNGNISFTSNVFVNKSFRIGHSNNIQVTFTGNTFYGKSSVQNWAAGGTSMTSLSNNYFQTPFEGILSLPKGYTSSKMLATSNYWEGAFGDIERVKSWILDRDDSSGRASTIALTPLLGSIPLSAPSYVPTTTTITPTTTTIAPTTTTTTTTLPPSTTIATTTIPTLPSPIYLKPVNPIVPISSSPDSVTTTTIGQVTKVDLAQPSIKVPVYVKVLKYKWITKWKTKKVYVPKKGISWQNLGFIGIVCANNQFVKTNNPAHFFGSKSKVCKSFGGNMFAVWNVNNKTITNYTPVYKKFKTRVLRSYQAYELYS